MTGVGPSKMLKNEKKNGTDNKYFGHMLAGTRNLNSECLPLHSSNFFGPFQIKAALTHLEESRWNNVWKFLEGHHTGILFPVD